MSIYSSEIQALLIYILSSEELFEQWCNAGKGNDWQDWIVDNGFDVHLLHSPELSSIVINIYGSWLGQIFYHLLIHKISYDYKSYLYYLEKSSSFYNNPSRDTAGGLSFHQVSIGLRRQNKIKSKSILIEKAASEVHEALSPAGVKDIHQSENQRREIHNFFSNAKSSKPGLSSQLSKDRKQYSSFHKLSDNQRRLLASDVKSKEKTALNTKWSQHTSQLQLKVSSNKQKLYTVWKEQKELSKTINRLKSIYIKDREHIKLVVSDLRKAEHWHAILQTQFGSVSQVDRELINFKNSLISDYNHDRSRIQELRSNLKDKRISFTTEMLLSEEFSKRNNDFYSFRTEWQKGKNKYQSFNIKTAYNNYQKDNDHQKGHFINRVYQEQNYFYNPEKKAYKQAQATYLADIKYGDTARQARNLASLSYFGSLLHSDMKLAAFAFLLNDRPISSTLTPYLPLAFHRQINIAKSIIRIDRHSFLWKTRVRFDVIRGNFVENNIAKAQNYALNTLEGFHPWRGFKHFLGSIGHDIWYSIGHSMHFIFKNVFHIDSTWLHNVDSAIWHGLGDTLHFIGKSLLNLPVKFGKNVDLLTRQIIKGCRVNGNGIKGWGAALDRDTKGLQKTLKFAGEATAWFFTGGLVFNNVIIKDEMKLIFVFKIIGIFPKKLALKSAVHLDLLKHSLKSDIHSRLHILHPNKYLLQIPSISKAYDKAEFKIAKGKAFFDSNPVQALAEANKAYNNRSEIISHEKAALITYEKSAKVAAYKWIYINVTAKSLEAWSKSQLSTDLSQYKFVRSLAGDHRLLRDGYISYRYHLKRDLSYLSKKELRRKETALISKLRTTANNDGYFISWNGFYAKNVIANRKSGFATWSSYFKGEQQIALFNKNNDNLLNMNIELSSGGFSYSISSPFYSKDIAQGWVSYSKIQDITKNIQNRVIDRIEKGSLTILVANQGSISHYVRKHHSFFHDVGIISAIHKSSAIKNYINAVQKEIKNDWVQGGGKQIFEGFRFGIDSLLIENNQTKKNFNTLIKNKNLGYKVFSDILLSYAIPHSFLQDVNASASRFKYSHQQLDKDLGSIFRFFVGSSSIIDRFKSLNKRLKVIYNFQRIGSIQISSKTISSLTSKWKDHILLQPIVNIVLSSAKWASLSESQQENIINNYNAIKSYDNKHQELKKLIAKSLSKDTKFDYYFFLDIKTDVKSINSGANMTIGQIVKTCMPSSSKWEPIADITQIQNYATPSSQSGGDSHSSQPNNSHTISVNLLHTTLQSIFLYTQVIKRFKGSNKKDLAEKETEEWDESLLSDSGFKESAARWEATEQDIVESDLLSDSGFKESAARWEAAEQDIVDMQEDLFRREHLDTKVKNKIESSDEIERAKSQIKDIESYDTGSLKGDLDDQLKTDCDELTQSLTDDLITDSDALIEIAVDKINATVSDVAPKISEDIDVVTQEADTIATDALSSL
ncbi:hypothetical protein ACLM45_03310 [Synechococcus sp. A10-1-5-9]|uniref:hypothetical protein n=1 Tax=Synechococcus sp. A10-1-5-9 TaxID=3392295 RepID=UPI0039E77E82